MSFTFYVDPALSAAYVRISGRVKAEDFSAAAQALYANSEMSLAYNVLWDLTGVIELDLLPEGVDLLTSDKKTRDMQVEGVGGRIAILVNRFVLEMAASLASVLGSTDVRPVQVFKSEQAACAWHCTS